MQNHPNISTQRCLLRLVQQSDVEHVHNIQSTPEVARYNTLPIPKDISESQLMVDDWMKEFDKDKIDNYTFVIEDKENKEFLGLFGLKLGRAKYQNAEVWYKLFPEHWGKGIATEAVNAVLKFGFEELHLHRIEAGCAVDNIGSIKVLEKVGMTREGRRRKTLPLADGWSDNFEYAILESEFTL